MPIVISHEESKIIVGLYYEVVVFTMQYHAYAQEIYKFCTQSFSWLVVHMLHSAAPQSPEVQV